MVGSSKIGALNETPLDIAEIINRTPLGIMELEILKRKQGGRIKQDEQIIYVPIPENYYPPGFGDEPKTPALPSRGYNEFDMR